MKKILRYLFVFTICFIGINSQVLAANITKCIYESNEAGAFDAQRGDTIIGKATITINVDKDGGLAPGVVFKPNSGKNSFNMGETKTKYLKASYFVDKNKKTKCPPKIYAIAAKGNPNYMTGNLIPTNFYFSTGLFTEKQLSEISSEYSTVDEVVEVNLSDSKNEGLETKIDGEYEKNQEEVNEKELPTKLDDDSKELVGCGLFGENTLPLMKKVFRFMRFGIPILVIILGLVDFLGIVFSGEEKYFKDAGTRFMKRLIAGVIILFVPYVLTFLINLSGLMKDYKIETDELFCIFGGNETKTVGEQAEDSTRSVCSNLATEEACDARKTSGCSWNSSEGRCFEDKTVGEQAEASTRNVCSNLTTEKTCNAKKSSGCSWNKSSGKCIKN